jgi:hypothetical protein
MYSCGAIIQQLNFALCRIRLFLDLWGRYAELLDALKRSQ